MTNPPALVEISGEAGIGRSRLVHEALGAGAERRRVLVGRCHPVRDRFTLGPVVEALRRAREPLQGRALTPLAGTLRQLLPEISGCLPPAPDPWPDPRAQRHRTFRALRELLEALGPTVCVLEDMHWADMGTLEFLSFILAEPPRELALVLTYRSEELDGPRRPLRSLAARAPAETSNVTIELQPLSVDQVRAMAGVLLAHDHLSQRSASSLHALTGGIPFAVEEVLRALKERGDPSPDSPGSDRDLFADLRVPPRVGHPVIERIARLGGDGRAVACASAVVGVAATEEVLRKVAGLTAARSAKALVQALGDGVLVEHGPGCYGLRHALATQAASESISTPERTRLHLRAAHALETAAAPRPLAQIAHHYKESGRSAQWARYAEAAADAASAVGDDRTAAQMLEEALAATGLPRATLIRMALKLGDAALFGRTPRQATRILRRTLDDGSLPSGRRGELRLQLARLLLLAGDGAYCRELVRAGEELRRRPGLAARACAILATWGPVEGDQHRQLAWSVEALEAAARADDPVVAIEVLTARAVALLDRGDPSGWRVTEELPRQPGSVAERLEIARSCKYLAKAALQLGHHRRARTLLDDGERIRCELGHDRFAVGLAAVRASLDWSTGAWTGLEATTRELMEATRDAPGLLASNQVTLGCLLLARGEVDRADEHLLSALPVVQNTQSIPGLAAVASGLATIRLGHGDALGARAFITLGLEGIRRHGLWACASTMAPVAVDGLLACGEPGEAEDIVRLLARGLRGRDAPGPAAALAFCRGAVSEAHDQHDLAGRWFAQSERAWAWLAAPYEAAKARERRGRCLLAERGPTAAADCLLGALEAFETQGAASDATSVRRTLRAHRIAAPSRAGRKGYGGELSPREVQVARLASRGATNREIAQALVISHRTVESHMASSLRKLRVSSRRAIPWEKFSVPE